MLEKDIQKKIIAWLKKRPCSYTWKQHAGIYAKAGLPDIMHVEKGQLYGFEVKRPGGKPTALQAITLKYLSQAGAITAVVHDVADVEKYLPKVREA